MMTIISGIFASILSGGATGLLGVVIQRFFDAWGKKQDIDIVRLNHENAKELRKLDLEHADKVAAGQIGVARENKEAAIGAAMEQARQAEALERSEVAKAEATLAAASIQSDRATYLTGEVIGSGSKAAAFFMGLIDFIRGLTRPVLTLYLIYIASDMFAWVQALEAKRGGLLTSGELKEIMLQVISTLLYLATVSIVWWFGTRPPKNPGDK